MPPACDAMNTTFADRAVEHQAEIQLAVDGRAGLDQQPLHLLPCGAGLVRDQLHAEDGLRCGIGVLDGSW